MTSKISFPKALKGLIKNHLASLLVTLLVFVMHFIVFFINLQNLMQGNWEEQAYLRNYARRLCSPSLVNGVVAAMVAVYLAYDYFRYLHSRKETDFYEALPVKRQNQFFARLLGSFLVFVIPCAVALGLEVIATFSCGIKEWGIITNMLWNLVCMILIYLCVWATAALAMVMTGHSIVAIFGFGAFVSYVPLILRFLFPVYADKFFKTYMWENQIASGKIAAYFSPATLAYRITSGYTWRIAKHWKPMLGSLAFTLIIGGIALLLHKKRPAEAAGRAMSFEKANPVIRILLVIPLSLYFGVLLSDFTESASLAWLIFGVIFACVLLHGVIESIFQFDVRAAFTRKKEFLLCAVCSLLFVAIFLFDIFKYDSFIPKAEKIESIEISSILSESNSYEIKGAKGVTGDRIQLALEIVPKLTGIIHDEDNLDLYAITYTYHMKSGRTMYRSYILDPRKIPEALDQLYQTHDFKEDHCALYTVDSDSIRYVSFSNGVVDKQLDFSKEERRKLIEIYLKEYETLTCTQAYFDFPSMELTFGLPVTDNRYSNMDIVNYMVYPQFTETLKFLSSYGVTSLSKLDGLKLKSLEFIFEDGKEQVIKDTELLETLRKDMICNDIFYWRHTDRYVSCDLLAEYNGEEMYVSIVLPKEVINPYLDQKYPVSETPTKQKD